MLKHDRPSLSAGRASTPLSTPGKPSQRRSRPCPLNTRPVSLPGSKARRFPSSSPSLATPASVRLPSAASPAGVAAPPTTPSAGSPASAGSSAAIGAAGSSPTPAASPYGASPATSTRPRRPAAVARIAPTILAGSIPARFPPPPSYHHPIFPAFSPKYRHPAQTKGSPPPKYRQPIPRHNSTCRQTTLLAPPKPPRNTAQRHVSRPRRPP